MSDDQDVFGEGYWDDRYGTSERIWSGRPNPQLVDRVASLRPGTALDVGCGEGADAIWLAQQGWDVTAVDVSQVALDKAEAHAASTGVDVAFRRVDLRGWPGEPGTYDLVSAQFMYLPRPDLPGLYQALGASVAPGGTLLLVGHDPVDVPHEHGATSDLPDVRWSAEEAASWLDPADWASVDLATVRRDGHRGVMHDAIVQATRA